ncbi:MAG: alpha-glucuronidase [Clostridiales bacterium]|nr:alpha-glucuronidase [Clostridiales bacterium]
MKQASGTPAWLPFLPMDIPAGNSSAQLARSELAAGLAALASSQRVELEVKGADEGYDILLREGTLHIRGGEPGVLYGTYTLLQALARGEPAPLGNYRPRYPLRMLNHWDNMDGSVERGYAGGSLFFNNNRLAYDQARIHRYARMLASVGINAICLNNVNVRPPMDGLILPPQLDDLAGLANLLRPYGIRLLVCVDFAMPARHEPGTADPLSPQVQAWWALRAKQVYARIPDLAGFVVKADSEHRPGPHTYGRSHAQGANMLARALKPHGGLLFWRCFVYNCRQDWRDRQTDRPKAAYEHYAPLDGQFDDNVVLQIKSGPVDFQVREPVSPLLHALPQTKKALELQLAQEYTGQQIDLFYQAAQWQDIFRQLPPGGADYIAAVSNLGDDESWCGHDLALANLYAFGRTAWRGESLPGRYAMEWAALSFPEAAGEITKLLLASPHVYEKYAAPLGLGFMVNPQTHYGPSPEGYEYALWGTYHRANHEAIGIDRGPEGTNFTAQYPLHLRQRFERLTTCPDRLLLFFHRLRYDQRLADGRSLLQRIYDDHFEGAQEAEALQAAWLELAGRVPPEVHARVARRFEMQVQNAREWRDVINTYFYRKSGIPDEQGRLIHP